MNIWNLSKEQSGPRLLHRVIDLSSNPASGWDRNSDQIVRKPINFPYYRGQEGLQPSVLQRLLDVWYFNFISVRYAGVSGIGG